MNKLKLVSGLFLSLFFSSLYAVPVTYQFTSAPIDDFVNEIIEPLRFGVVSGTFDYDNSVPLTASDVIFPGANLYLGAMSNLSGEINGYNFSQDSGEIVVGNDSIGGRDIMLTLWDSSFFNGFTVDNYTATSFGFSWVEDVPIGSPAFLDSSDLLDVLPTNRLAQLTIGFVNNVTGGNVSLDSVYVTLEQVSVDADEPGIWMLLGIGLIAINAASARRRTRRSLTV